MSTDIKISRQYFCYFTNIFVGSQRQFFFQIFLLLHTNIFGCPISRNVLLTNIFVVAGSEEAPEQDSLDGHLVASSSQGKAKRGRRQAKEAAHHSSSEEEDNNNNNNNSGNSKGKPSQPPPPPSQPQSKPALKASSNMDRAQSNFSHKSGVSKTSKVGSKAGASRPASNSAAAVKKTGSLDLNPFSGVLWDRREPFAQLWVTLSAMYGKLLVLLMFAFCLIEVMDNKIRPLYFQNFFMMYLYCGSIIAIMCIYITVLLDNCPGVTSSREQLTANTAGDPEVGSIGSLGTLRRAHISRNKVSRTSFYLRVGALGMPYAVCTGDL